MVSAPPRAGRRIGNAARPSEPPRLWIARTIIVPLFPIKAFRQKELIYCKRDVFAAIFLFEFWNMTRDSAATRLDRKRRAVS